jgi:hypothetical protein
MITAMSKVATPNQNVNANDIEDMVKLEIELAQVWFYFLKKINVLS